VTLFVESFGDSLRHFELTCPELEIGVGFGEDSARGEEVSN
jgi:hypothetical protein